MIAAAHAQEFLEEAAGITNQVQDLANLLNFFGIVVLMLAPPIIALLRRHPNRIPIFAITVAFGWSGVVWIVMLVKALGTPATGKCDPLGPVAGLTLLGLCTIPFMSAFALKIWA